MTMMSSLIVIEDAVYFVS